MNVPNILTQGQSAAPERAPIVMEMDGKFGNYHPETVVNVVDLAKSVIQSASVVAAPIAVQIINHQSPQENFLTDGAGLMTIL